MALCWQVLNSVTSLRLLALQAGMLCVFCTVTSPPTAEDCCDGFSQSKVPVVISPSTDVIEGQTVILSCRRLLRTAGLLSKKQVNVCWRVNKKALARAKRFVLSDNNRTLTIEQIKKSDGGIYTCHAKWRNQGYSSLDQWLTVETTNQQTHNHDNYSSDITHVASNYVGGFGDEKLKSLLLPVQNVRVFHNKRCGANVTWTYDTATAPGVRFVVELYYYTVGPCCGPHIPKGCNYTSLLWCEMENWSCDILYNMRVFAVNNEVKSAPSQIYSFVYGIDTPPGCPRLEKASPWTLCSLRVLFRVGVDYASLITQGSVVWSIRYRNSSAVEVVNVTRRQSTYRLFDFILGGLACNASYTVSISAWTNISNVFRTTGFCSNIMAVSGKRVPPSPASVSLVALGTGIKISWKMPYPLQVGATSGYIICHSKQDSHNPCATLAADGVVCSGALVNQPEKNSYSLQGLDADATYAVNVTAFNSNGIGNPSVLATVRTSTAKPSWCVPPMILCDRVAPSTAHLFWQPPMWNGPDQRYSAQLASRYDEHVYVKETINSSVTYLTVQGLVEDASYMVTLHACNSNGCTSMAAMTTCPVYAALYTSQATALTQQPAYASAATTLPTHHQASDTANSTTLKSNQPPSLSTMRPNTKAQSESGFSSLAFIIVAACGGALFVVITTATILLVKYARGRKSTRSQMSTILSRLSEQRQRRSPDTNHYVIERPQSPRSLSGSAQSVATGSILPSTNSSVPLEQRLQLSDLQNNQYQDRPFEQPELDGDSYGTDQLNLNALLEASAAAIALTSLPASSEANELYTFSD